MNDTVKKYKDLKSKLTENVGHEQSVIEVGYNDDILEQMDKLLKPLHKDIAKLIKFNHI